MKHRLSKFLFMLLISFCVNCFSDCNCPDGEIRFVTCPKTYVTADQIAFYENGIFVQINDFVIQTESLSTDGQGIFFANLRANGCGPNMWKCTRPLDQYRGMPCNTCNWVWNYTCSFCGKDKK